MSIKQTAEVTMIRLADGSDACHRADCADLKKISEMDILESFETIQAAQTAWNAHDEDNWSDWVRVMPCAKEAAGL